MPPARPACARMRARRAGRWRHPAPAPGWCARSPTATSASSRTHVRIAHQHDGAAAAGPGEDLQAVLVVVVVRALALRSDAPGAGDVARGEDILQEVQRERLVGQHGAGERGPLGGRQLRLPGQPAGLLQRAEMEVANRRRSR